MIASGELEPKPAAPDKEGLIKAIARIAAEGFTLTHREIESIGGYYGYGEGHPVAGLFDRNTTVAKIAELGVSWIKYKHTVPIHKKVVRIYSDGNLRPDETDLTAKKKEIDEVFDAAAEQTALRHRINRSKKVLKPLLTQSEGVVHEASPSLSRAADALASYDSQRFVLLENSSERIESLPGVVYRGWYNTTSRDSNGKWNSLPVLSFQYDTNTKGVPELTEQTMICTGVTVGRQPELIGLPVSLIDLEPENTGTGPVEVEPHHFSLERIVNVPLVPALPNHLLQHPALQQSA